MKFNKLNILTYNKNKKQDDTTDVAMGFGNYWCIDCKKRSHGGSKHYRLCPEHYAIRLRDGDYIPADKPY
ncbi:MAG: hypothetical protein ACPG8V_01730 [Alphaproteobacteria bacterium]